MKHKRLLLRAPVGASVHGPMHVSILTLLTAQDDVYGWDFAGNNPSVFDGVGDDHGTSVGCSCAAWQLCNSIRSRCCHAVACRALPCKQQRLARGTSGPSACTVSRIRLPCCSHVAGTIGATGNNSLGVAGVSWRVKLLSGKFLGSNGGTTANAIKAVGALLGFVVLRAVTAQVLG